MATNQVIAKIDNLLDSLTARGDLSSKDPKSYRNAKKFRILDGGFGTWLHKKGLPQDDELWSLAALIDKQYHPMIISAHKDYLKAGAGIIATNTYSCVPLYIDNCEKSDKWPFEGKPDGPTMSRLAVDLANTARTEFIAEEGIETDSPSKPLIAASIPPLMESYNPNTVLSESQSINHYNQIIRTFKSTEIDLFLIETMNTFNEAKNVLNAMICNGLTKDGDDGRDIYLFFALKENGKLRGGLDFNEMMVKLEEYLNILPIVMVGANCCKPEVFGMMMEGINKKTLEILQEKDLMMGCYPNGFGDIPDNFVLTEDNPGLETRTDLTPDVMYNKYYREWIKKYSNDEYRFRLIGGCCFVFPDVIEYAAKNIKVDFPELLSDGGRL